MVDFVRAAGRPAPVNIGGAARRLASVLLGVGAGFVGAVLLGNRRVTVGGLSMLPLLAEHESVLVDRLAYWWERPRRGDIVLVRGGGGEAGSGEAGGPPLLLKRLVGLPGEHIAVSRDRLWVDGRPLDLGRPRTSC